MEKLKEANLEINETNERYMRELLRKEYGMGAYAVISLPKIKEYIKESNVIIDGLYSWDELKILKSEFNDNLYVLGIVVNKKDRYERLLKREFRSLDNEKARKRDITEIENLSKGGPIAFSDYYILNNGNIDDYYKDLEKVTKNIMNM